MLNASEKTFVQEFQCHPSLEGSEPYRKLLAMVEADEASDLKHRSRPFHDYRGKLEWIVDRVHHYAEKTGVNAVELLAAWEKDRRCWYMGYYQDAFQPKIGDGKVFVFSTVAELLQAIGKRGFRCPSCGGVSNNPHTCDTGVTREDGTICDWKSYGLFGTLGKGAVIFVREKLKVETIFMPIAFENGGA